MLLRSRASLCCEIVKLCTTMRAYLHMPQVSASESSGNFSQSLGNCCYNDQKDAT